MKLRDVAIIICVAWFLFGCTSVYAGERFEGDYYCGEGDREYIELLDTARRFLDPDPEFQNLPMLYTPAWNGFVEGPTWGAWWIQNSYGPTYCALPMLTEPYITFLQNSQDLWFNHMGDGKNEYKHTLYQNNSTITWVPPDGCLVDAASPGWAVHKQGDGRVDIHDWGMEFTAAGTVMQAELLLISRNEAAIHNYLPKLERCVNFIETRRDPQTNLFLAGPAGNLLAPSYAGWKKPDGTYDKAYLTGLSITYIAALDRIIELEKLAGSPDKVKLYSERRDFARKGLPLLTTDEGYFMKSLDPDGARHGVYGAPKHGYFEAVCNHDAVCFRIADDEQAEKIYQKIASIPGLRVYDCIITNCPSLDDMYESTASWLWSFGTWVNGGHWSTCEARMIMGYYRLGKYEDARRSMKHLLTFARRFRLDNPLVNFGNGVYQPHQPINLVYDSFGIPTAMNRGLFEYLYHAEGLTILPHIPPSITLLEQRFPIRFGKKVIYLASYGSGPITGVVINRRPCLTFDKSSVLLSYADTPDTARIQIALEGSPIQPFRLPTPKYKLPPFDAAICNSLFTERICAGDSVLTSLASSLPARLERLNRFYSKLLKAGLDDSYEASHARLALEYVYITQIRSQWQRLGILKPLNDHSQLAADRSYILTIGKLCEGIEKVLESYRRSDDETKYRIFQLWYE